MAASFESQGLTLPPWRRPQAMSSKWLPLRCHDTPVAPPGPGQEAGTAQAVANVLAAVAAAAAAAAGSCSGSDSEGGSCSGASPDAPLGDVMPPVFSRLDDGELLQNALTRRHSRRGLLSGKLLGSSASPPSGSAAVQQHGNTVVQQYNSGCTAVRAAPGAVQQAVQAPGAVHKQQRRAGGGADAGCPYTVAAVVAAVGGGAVAVGGEGGGAAGALGVLSRQPPVCSGQPAMWRVRLHPSQQQLQPKQPRQ